MIILFDLDGTLIDSTEAILESFHKAFEIHGAVSPSDEMIKSLIGHPLDYMFVHLGVEEKKVWDFVASYKEHYRQISTQKTVLLPRAEETIELASTFATLGIVTTKTGRYSKILMEYFGVMEKFAVLVGREDVEEPKPAAEPILKALSQLPARDEEVWMIGDTTMDLLSAKNAGVNSIGVRCGYGSNDELNAYTNVIFSDAYEAVSYLKRSEKSHNRLA